MPRTTQEVISARKGTLPRQCRPIAIKNGTMCRTLTGQELFCRRGGSRGWWRGLFRGSARAWTSGLAVRQAAFRYAAGVVDEARMRVAIHQEMAARNLTFTMP